MSYRPTVSRVMPFDAPGAVDLPVPSRDPTADPRDSSYSRAYTPIRTNPRDPRPSSDPAESSHGSEPSNHPGAKPRDPGWDSASRDGWSYPLSTRGIHRARRHPAPVHGSHWWKFTIDPYGASPQCDVDTGAIAPWYAERPGFGRILNHPVCLNMQHLDKNQFLSHFRYRGEFESKALKEFKSGFPACPDNAELHSLLKYHATVVKYSTTYKVFVPPAHTLRSHNLLGIWFDDLNDDYQGHVAHTFPQILSQCLLSKQANLLKQPLFGSLLLDDTNGYHILYHLAML